MTSPQKQNCISSSKTSCAKCGGTEKYMRKNRPSDICAPCHRQRQTQYNLNPVRKEKISAYMRQYTKDGREKANRCKNRYGFTLLEKRQRLIAQGNKCGNPSCGATEPGGVKGWHTDHCHDTEKVRGELCLRCNVALGMVQHDIHKLLGLVKYMKQHHPELN